jgi:hypothetical protein
MLRKLKSNYKNLSYLIRLINRVQILIKMMLITVKMIEKLLIMLSRSLKNIRGGVNNNNKIMVIAIPTLNQQTTRLPKAKQVQNIIRKSD